MFEFIKDSSMFMLSGNNINLKICICCSDYMKSFFLKLDKISSYNIYAIKNTHESI